MLKNTIKKIRHRVRQRLVLSYIFERLSSVGITIRLYYLTQEFLFDEKDLKLRPELESIAIGFLSSSEIKIINDHPESKWSDRENIKLLEEGCQCFGLKHNDEIAAYMWCNLSGCHEISPFPLKEDEAYLTRAFTFRDYRGKSLAPFLRYQLCKHLNEIGRTKIYSYTDVFNTPAIKFKMKLKAKPIKIIFDIKLFSKYHLNFVMSSPKHFVITI